MNQSLEICQEDNLRNKMRNLKITIENCVDHRERQVHFGSTCICTRKRRLVLCTVCGYHTKGRVRIFCADHPQTIFIMDITQCPKCKCDGLMLKEF